MIRDGIVPQARAHRGFSAGYRLRALQGDAITAVQDFDTEANTRDGRRDHRRRPAAGGRPLAWRPSTPTKLLRQRDRRRHANTAGPRALVTAAAANQSPLAASQRRRVSFSSVARPDCVAVRSWLSNGRTWTSRNDSWESNVPCGRAMSRSQRWTVALRSTRPEISDSRSVADDSGHSRTRRSLSGRQIRPPVPPLG
jgi:hypothetical protein